MDFARDSALPCVLRASAFLGQIFLRSFVVYFVYFVVKQNDRRQKFHNAKARFAAS
jgi:hypothetical protein